MLHTLDRCYHAKGIIGASLILIKYTYWQYVCVLLSYATRSIQQVWFSILVILEINSKCWDSLYLKVAYQVLFVHNYSYSNEMHVIRLWRAHAKISKPCASLSLSSKLAQLLSKPLFIDISMHIICHFNIAMCMCYVHKMACLSCFIVALGNTPAYRDLKWLVYHILSLTHWAHAMLQHMNRLPISVSSLRLAPIAYINSRSSTV